MNILYHNKILLYLSNRVAINTIIMMVTGSAKPASAQEFKFFFLTQLIAILNSYPYTVSCGQTQVV